MADNPVGAPSNPTIRFERSPVYRSIFSNFFRYLPSIGDFAVTFSRITGAAAPGGGAVIVDETEVTVTYMQLKIIYEHLAIFMSVYERELGVIEIPPSQRPDTSSLEEQIRNLKAAWGRI